MNEIISFMRDEPLVMTLCPEEESILLNKNVLDHLEQPRQVQILINEEQGMLLLKVGVQRFGDRTRCRADRTQTVV